MTTAAMSTTMTKPAVPFSQKLWDVLTKLAVAGVIGVFTYVESLARRVTDTEYAVRNALTGISEVKQQLTVLQNDSSRKQDVVIEKLEALGNRLTRIETKLENR
jgi:hypothetical protein